MGAAATGEVACRAARAAAAQEAPAGAPMPGMPPMPAMTPNHQLVDSRTGLPMPMTEPTPREGIPGRKWVMVIDLSKCDGCGSCTKACSKMHFIPPDRQWISVYPMQESEMTAPYFFPKPCFHCDNPPCTKVCPVNATFKRQDGIVLIDNERCIGCRFCMAACPYGARSFNWNRPHESPAALAEGYSPEHGFPRRVGTVEKCDFCPDMAAMGMVTACTAGCPMGAIYYGDENEDAVTNSQNETLRFSKLMLDRSGYRYLEELGTKPRVYYLPPKNRQFAPPAPEHKT
jgi:molybdopterin-containing oxidoreductase family iron-sulfur binding subunit